MLQAHRPILLGILACAWLSACGSTSVGTESGTIASSAGGTSGAGTGTTTGGFTKGGGSSGTHDTVVMTPATAGVFSVAVGASQTLSIAFTSSDGKTMSGFAISNSLGSALPAGWTGPANFGCATVSTGSGCVLNLKYSPTAYNSGGTVTLQFVYVDNSGEPVTVSSATLNYQATTNDNVVTMAAPMGQINATTNAGSSTVVETFTTDDTFPASALSVDLTTLPSDWHGPSTFNCATVSTGTSCQLSLTYTPTMPAMGTLMLNYTFNDDSGTAKASAFNVVYASTANNVVLNSIAPSSSISVVSGMGDSQSVTVTFTTDDTFPASNLMLDLSALPPAWSSASSPQFACASVSAGVACQVSLNYVPAAPGDSGTLQLPYTYFDDAGVQKNDTVNITYSST